MYKKIDGNDPLIDLYIAYRSGIKKYEEDGVTLTQEFKNLTTPEDENPVNYAYLYDTYKDIGYETDSENTELENLKEFLIRSQVDNLTEQYNTQYNSTVTQLEANAGTSR